MLAWGSLLKEKEKTRETLELLILSALKIEQEIESSYWRDANLNSKRQTEETEWFPSDGCIRSRSTPWSPHSASYITALIVIGSLNQSRNFQSLRKIHQFLKLFASPSGMLSQTALLVLTVPNSLPHVISSSAKYSSAYIAECQPCFDSLVQLDKWKQVSLTWIFQKFYFSQQQSRGAT